MTLHDWISENGGIAHRRAIEAAGFTVRAQRAAVRGGEVRRIRRHWLATDAAPTDLVAAAESGGQLACVSVARRRAWWVPEGVAESIHVRVDPNGASPRPRILAQDAEGPGLVVHWTKRIAPAPGYGLLESTEDALSHIAQCLTPENARVLWESAVRVEGLSLQALQQVRWPSATAREYAGSVAGLSDSGLETLFVVRLGGWGLPIVQQSFIAGHRVDLLIGDRLVVQIDGFAHHSDSAQRTRDVALDAELTLRGYTVLHFTYAQVVYEWASVERSIARAIATGAHRAR